MKEEDGEYIGNNAKRNNLRKRTHFQWRGLNFHCYFAFAFIKEGNSQSVINVRIALKQRRQNKAERARVIQRCFLRNTEATGNFF